MRLIVSLAQRPTISYSERGLAVVHVIAPQYGKKVMIIKNSNSAELTLLNETDCVVGCALAESLTIYSSERGLAIIHVLAPQNGKKSDDNQKLKFCWTNLVKWDCLCRWLRLGRKSHYFLFRTRRGHHTCDSASIRQKSDDNQKFKLYWTDLAKWDCLCGRLRLGCKSHYFLFGARLGCRTRDCAVFVWAEDILLQCVVIRYVQCITILKHTNSIR